MRIFERIAVAVFTLLAIIVGIALILISTELIGLQYFSTSISTLYGNLETGVGGIALLILSFSYLVYTFKSRGVPEAVVRNGELGKVCITLGAVENIVQKVLRDVEEVKESRIYIKKQEDGVSITIKVTVNYDVIIPDLASELQKTIKDYVESTAGISVKNVRISVNNVSNQTKQK